MLHEQLLELRAALNYRSTEGVCYGFTIRWLEAILLGNEEENHFYNRLSFIENHSPEEIIRIIDQIASKKGQQLGEEEQTVLDLLGFLDSLEIFQFGNKPLFGQFMTSIDIPALSELGSSDKIQKLGGLYCPYLETLNLSRKEFTHYFDQLETCLKSSSNFSENRGFILSDEEHSIGIVYKPGQGWFVKDINQASIEPFKAIDHDDLVDMIFEAFTDPLESDINFNIALLSPTLNPHNAQLEKLLSNFKASHIITQDMLNRPSLKYLAYMAAESGDVKTIADLAKAGVDLNQASPKGSTPAYIAAECGYDKVITELNKAKVDLNQLSQEGYDLAYVAAEFNHSQVITELAKAGVDLNQPAPNGYTPAYLATTRGHDKVLAELAKAKVDLSQTAANGYTLAYLAATKGYDKVIAELVKAGVDLNQANRQGVTPVFAAAFHGRANVIKELIKANVSLQTPLSLTLAEWCHILTKLDAHFTPNPMANFLTRFPNGKISMLPAEIATIMGHQDIAQMIQHHISITTLSSKLKTCLMQLESHSLSLFSTYEHHENGKELERYTRELTHELNRFSEAYKSQDSKTLTDIQAKFSQIYQKSKQAMQRENEALALLDKVENVAKAMGLMKTSSQLSNSPYYTRKRPAVEEPEIKPAFKKSR